MNDDELFGFHIGDIVRVKDHKTKGDVYSPSCLGKTGVVVGRGGGGYPRFISVDFEGSLEPFEHGLHTCKNSSGELVPSGCGQWIPPYDLEYITEPVSIDITEIL